MSIAKKKGSHTEPFWRRTGPHVVGHYEKLRRSNCRDASNFWFKFRTLVYFKGVKSWLWITVVILSSPSQSAVWVWFIKWECFASSVLSFCLPLFSVLFFVAKMRSPAACCRYFWGMWSLERRSRTNASLRWWETPERCGRWEGPWGGTRWVWLTLIDRLLSYLLYLVK